MSAAAQQACPADLVARRSGWPLERVLFAMACTVVLLGALLSAVVSPWFSTPATCAAA